MVADSGGSGRILASDAGKMSVAGSVESLALEGKWNEALRLVQQQQEGE